MTDWVRLWHDMPTDPKWRVIARKSGQPLACVIALFTMLMVSASQNSDERGVLIGWNDEDAAAALDLEPEQVSAIIAAMQGKVLNGDRLSGWDRRQPKREDNSAERVKAYRERKRTEGNAGERTETQPDEVKRIVTQRNAPDADADAEYSVAKATGAAAPENSDKAFWESSKDYLRPHIKGDPGAMIGKWCRDYGKPETAKAITAAQLERAVDPVSFIQATLRRSRTQSEAMPIC